MAKAHTLSDNFNDNLRDSARWKSDGDVQEVNQRVEARPPPHINDGYAGYTSADSYDLTDSWVKLEVLRTLSVPGGSTYLRAGQANNTVRVAVSDGRLSCIQTVGGVDTTLSVVPYNPVDHRWWQLRESGGTTFWEVSSDGQRWTTLFSKSTPVDLTLVKLSFQASTDDPSPRQAWPSSARSMPPRRAGRAGWRSGGCRHAPCASRPRRSSPGATTPSTPTTMTR